MANIMLTEVCNLRCPYCFANEFVNGNVNDKHISLENFKKALDFSFTGENERIGIIGGEPTVHPQFKEIMEILIYDERVRDFVVFTNLINADKYINVLVNPKARLTVNCNTEANMGSNLYKRMLNNLDTFLNDYYMKDRITLGINMYKPDFEYEYIVELLKKYGFSHVRTSIVVPNTDTLRGRNPIEYFKDMKESVFRFFRELEKINVMPTYDCNLLPQCLVTPEENEWLKTFWQYEAKSKNYCNLCDDCKCTPVIDILPNLDAVRCFGMSSAHKVPIERFQNIKELKDYYFNLFDVFAYTVASNPDCEMCEKRQKMLCTGGCLGFKIDKLNKAREICSKL